MLNPTSQGPHLNYVELKRCPLCRAPEPRVVGRPLTPRVYRFPRQDILTQELSLSSRRLMECARCHLRYYAKIPDPSWTAELAAVPGIETQWSGSRRLDKLVDRLAAILGDPLADRSLSSLDIGCHTGEFLGRLPRNWSKFGVEINPHTAAIAKETVPEAEILSSDFLSAPLEAGQFHLITAWDFMEHAPQLHEVIRRISHLLSPGGWFIFETGDYTSAYARAAGMAWNYYSVFDHVVFFRQGMLRGTFGSDLWSSVAVQRVIHSHVLDVARTELLSSRVKALVVILYTLGGRIHRLHQIASLVLGRDGTLPQPYYADHLFVAARKQP